MRFNITKLILVCFLGITYHAFSANNGYSIKLKIHGLKDTVCYLANYYGSKQYLQDTAKVDSQGRFKFEGKEKRPQGIYMIVLPDKKYFDFIMDAEQHFSMETDTSDFVKNMKIKGSDENKLFFDYLLFIAQKHEEAEPLRKKYKDMKEKGSDLAEIIKSKLNIIDNEVKSYKLNIIQEYPQFFVGKLFKSMEEPVVPEAPLLENGKKDSLFAFRYYKSHFFDNIDFSDERLLRTPVFHNKIEQYIKNLVVQIPDSINIAADYLVEKARANKEIFKYIVWYITNTYETSNIMGMDAVFVYMAEKYYTHEQAYWLDSTQIYKISQRAKTLKPILIGKIAPNLALSDTSGVTQVLNKVKANYTVLAFWDPDCGHCQKSMPKLVEVYNKLKSKGVEVYAVCTEIEVDKWKKFIREHKLNWINVADPYLQNNFRAFYDITSTPQFFILDDKKKIVAKKIDVDQIEEIIDFETKKKSKSH